jgi:hypothetical protein
LKNNLGVAVLNHFGLYDRYLSDPVFRKLFNTIIGVVVGALTHTSKPATKTTDMEELQKIFRAEAGLG